eukprot:TRINITY_DN10134_c0_g1_i1.p1 TRINITY_DN10134_c0_g1~~TRINITY_DN10134_c0_g1_i1.p1  ORF type:complete len:475 (-),score=104.02 TRINITY_DN10134_c0_g1_i1:101-1525(-)
MEDQKELLRLLLKNSDCIIVCFSLMSADTFLNARQTWLPFIRERVDADVPLVLCGTRKAERDALALQDKSKALSSTKCKKISEDLNCAMYFEIDAMKLGQADVILKSSILTGLGLYSPYRKNGYDLVDRVPDWFGRMSGEIHEWKESDPQEDMKVLSTWEKKPVTSPIAAVKKSEDKPDAGKPQIVMGGWVHKNNDLYKIDTSGLQEKKEPKEKEKEKEKIVDTPAQAKKALRKSVMLQLEKECRSNLTSEESDMLKLGGTWRCTKCNFKNVLAHLQCEVCYAKRDAATEERLRAALASKSSHRGTLSILRERVKSKKPRESSPPQRTTPMSSVGVVAGKTQGEELAGLSLADLKAMKEMYMKKLEKIDAAIKSKEAAEALAASQQKKEEAAAEVSLKSDPKAFLMAQSAKRKAALHGKDNKSKSARGPRPSRVNRRTQIRANHAADLQQLINSAAKETASGENFEIFSNKHAS